MEKTILITGATDGIGLVTAKKLAQEGHVLLLHGRNPAKLESAKSTLASKCPVETYVADLSSLNETTKLADAIINKHKTLDVIINNAGVFRMANPITTDGLDSRFVVNAIAPYLLTQKLMPLLKVDGRVVNLSSAAQAPVDIDTLTGKHHLSDEFQAYAQSKLALTMWSKALGDEQSQKRPVIVSVNPGSMLGSKMVKEGFGVAGGDINIGADILIKAALSDSFSDAGGCYFDNDAKCFSNPHADALDTDKVKQVITAIESVIARLS